MLRTSLIALGLLASGTAAAQERMSDYVRGIYEERCFKQELEACLTLINGGYEVPGATRARALALRGEARLGNGQVDAALADLNAAAEIARAPQDPAMAKLDAARGVPGLTPDWQSGLQAKLAEALLRKSDLAGARAAADKAVALKAGSVPALSIRAQVAAAEGRLDAALADFDKALQIGVPSAAARAELFWRRGNVRAALRQPSAAQLADYDSAIAADPTFADSYYSRGFEYQNAGRHEDALRDFEQVVVRAPGFAGGYNSACWARAAYLKREFDKARADCDRALALNPEANTYDSAGLVALQQGRWQDAWTAYDKAVKGDAKMASARYGRGIAARRLGRTGEGDADLAAASAMEAGIAAQYAGYGQRP